MSSNISVQYDDEPSTPPEKGRCVKSELRLAVEKIKPGYSAFFPEHTRQELERVTQRIRVAQPGSKLALRKLSGGVRVWRLK